MWEVRTDGQTAAICSYCDTALNGTDPSSGAGRDVMVATATGALRVASGLDGQVRTVTGISQARQPTWLPDGKGVVVASTVPESPLRRLSITDPYQPAATAVTPLAGADGGWRPTVSPRGDHLAFLVGPVGSTRVVIGSLSGDSPPRTLMAAADNRHLSWAPDGSRLVVTQRSSTGSTVYSIDPATAVATSIHSTAARIDAALLRVIDVGAPTITISPTPSIEGTRTTVAFSVTDDT